MTEFSPTVPVLRSARLSLIVAWLVVGIPAAWGVEQTLIKSMALFQRPQPAATVAAPASIK